MVFVFILIFIIIISAFVVYFYYQQPSRVQVQKTQFLSRYIEVEGYKIHYFQEGKGAHVVLLHGLAASSYTWRYIIQPLSKKYTVTAIDILGFGLSDKPRDFSYNLDDQSDLIVKILNQLKIEQVRLVGSSMGGALSLWIAKKYPQKILEVVVLSPAIDPSHIKFNFHKLHFMGSIVFPVVTRTFVRTIMRKVINKPNMVNDETVEAYFSPYSENPAAVQAFFKSISIIRDRRLPEEIKNITTPTLMLWGGQDHIVSVRVGQKIHKAIPQFQFVVHPTAGHHSMEDEPDWVLDQVSSFFDTQYD